MQCPYCSSPISANAQFCPSCGGRLNPSQHLPAGTILDRKYRIEKPLGQGGFGITYLAKHITLNQAVAIKEFFPEGAFRTSSTHVSYRTPDKASTHAVIQEAQAIARFNHPGIVKVFDVFEENNTAYVVMEFLTGITLEERIGQKPPSSPAEVVEVAIKAAEALSIIHQKNLLHRDLKPGNIFLSQGRVVLIDFGSAREFAHNKTVGHTRILSPGYAPLEQYASAARLAPYTDIYALGATLYHALSGQAPPDAPNRTQGVEVPPLPQEVPAFVQQAIFQALHTDTSKRPQSAEAFVALLKNAATPQTTSSAPPPRKYIRKVASLKGHRWPITSLAFSPDGKILASGGSSEDDGEATIIKLWDVATKQETATLKGDSWELQVLCLAFSPDGNTLASGSQTNIIKLWDVATRKVKATLRGHSRYVFSLAFSPDGTLLASGSDESTIKLWNVATRSVIASLRRHYNIVTSVAFSPDGKILASGSWDATIRLWDVATRKEIASLWNQSNRVTSVAFSPDGTTLASGSWDATIRLWDVESRKEVETLEGHSSIVNNVAFSPDGKILASEEAKTVEGSVLNFTRLIRLWDVETRKVIETLSGESVFVFSPDGKTLASTSGDNTIKLWQFD